jgi:hypothetical protein
MKGYTNNQPEGMPKMRVGILDLLGVNVLQIGDGRAF